MDKQTILNELQPLQGTKKVIVENQSTGDIIEGILDTHKRYQNQYDKIYKYFIGSSLNETCNNIWQFLKDNVKYYVEPQRLQTLRSPAAILSKAADCKSYSLFANGILDAYRRNENKNFDVCYRFAGYTKPKRIEHVFSVCIDKKGNEIWTDAVLNGFNDRFTIPVYSRDKKINNMALVAMAGVPQNRNWRNQGVSYESVGNVPHIYYGHIYGTEDENTYNQEEFDAKKVDWNKIFSDLNNTLFGSTQGIVSNPPSKYYEPMLFKMSLNNSLFRPDVYQRIAGFRDIICNLDNSTYKWKCIRNRHLNNWAPVERMLWYLQGLNSGEIPVDWIDTYADGYGHKPDSDKVSNDESKLPYNLAEVWNDTIKKMTNDQNRLNNWLINETITQGYNPANSIKNYKPQNSNNNNIPNNGKKLNILPLALVALAAKFLIFK